MALVQSSSATNDLLGFLPKSQRQLILKHCLQVELKLGQVLNPVDEPVEYIYFPTSGFIAQLIEIQGGQSIEVSLIGNEGLLGATLALGNSNAPMQSVVQGAGYALRMDSALFEQCLGENPAFSKLIYNYLYVLIKQSAQSSACNNFHDVQQRLARLLLMIQNRAHSNHLYLTHHFLATMLGVRRSAVTIAAGILQQKGFISYSRGHIKVLSRAHLKHASCECYFASVDIYQKHLKSLV